MTSLWRKGEKRGQLGRVDLLLAYYHGQQQDLEQMAAKLGYQRKPEPIPTLTATSSKDPRPGTDSETLPKIGSAKLPYLEFWYLAERQIRQLAEEADAAQQLLDRAQPMQPNNGPASYRQPPIPKPLADSNTLEQLAWRSLRTLLPSKEIDNDALVERLAQCRDPDPIPYQRFKGTVASCQIIIDFSPQLSPYRADFKQMAGLLNKRLSHAAELWFFSDLGEGHSFRVRSLDDREPRQQPYRPSSESDMLVILSDLGSLSRKPEKRQYWQQLLQQARRHRQQVVTLLPDGRHYRQLNLRTSLKLTEQIPRLTKQLQAQLDRLLIRLAGLLSCTAAHLRDLRRSIPEAANLSQLEALVWDHPHVTADRSYLKIADDQAASYREKFRASLSQQQQADVWESLRDHRVGGAPETQALERLLLKTLMDRDEIADSAFLASALKTMAGQPTALGQPTAFGQSVATWIGRSHRRMDPSMWQKHDLLSRAFLRCREIFADRVDLALPAGLDHHKYRDLDKRADRLRQWAMVQEGQELSWQPFPWRPDKGLGTPMPLAQITCASLTVRIERDQSLAGQVMNLDGKQTIPLQDHQQLRIHSERETLVLRKQAKPDWARAMGRDQEGLFVALKEEDRRLYWWEPGVIELDTGATWLRETGAWTDAAAYRSLQPSPLAKPPWASQWGVDDDGIYADMAIDGVVQRMRLIFPGEFLMGSPEDEPEREKDEGPQHPVIVSKPYWLADTACTQALWRAMNGNNPSRFKGEELPVEQVSWNAVVHYLNRLKQTKPQLALRLPSEAEWEYACRAGRQTPFSFGQQITPEEVNYNGNYPYNKGPKGEDRGKTVSVKALPANSWGLYQMHGNVWEWCQDWYASYAADLAIDPSGAVEGQGRVLRGGGWISYAWSCRAVCRFDFVPDCTWYYSGFRLALGWLPYQASEKKD